MYRAAAVILTLFWLITARSPCSAGEKSFPRLFSHEGRFVSAIDQTGAQPYTQKITGLTVPHHLLASDLIAGAFSRLSNQSYKRIVILSPDHFGRSQTPFALAGRDFRTPLGVVPVDDPAVVHVLKNPRVSISNLFSHEHGVRSLLPFMAYYFPGAKVLALAIRSDSRPAEWDSLAETLVPLLTSDTLLLQSTDFSHYLPPALARIKDQETLRVLSNGSPEQVLGLSESDHLDSKAAQYLQLKLQRQVYGAKPVVIANRNSQEYIDEAIDRTTSYIIQVYSPQLLPLDIPNRYFFAGDTFFGRFGARLLSDPGNRRKLVEKVLRITGGAPLLVNLEGVVMDNCPDGLGPYDLCMETEPALNLLRDLNIRMVSLANNHSHDFGPDGYTQMKRLLKRSGATILENGKTAQSPDFDLLALTDVDNHGPRHYAALTEADLAAIPKARPHRPLFAFIHWGREYTAAAGVREQQIAALLEERGVELIIGSHSHRAGHLVCVRSSCRVFSLGNFFFDQSKKDVSGALLEVIFFRQGTYFLRLHDLGNPYKDLFSD